MSILIRWNTCALRTIWALEREEWNLEESLKKYFEMMEKSYNEILIKLEDVKKDSAHGFEKVKLTKEQ